MYSQYHNTYIAILAGNSGAGSQSYKDACLPTNYTDFLGMGKTLVQQTVDRYKAFVPVSHIFVITAKELEQVTQQQLPELPEENIICEPMQKNTAPALAYICFKLALFDSNCSLIVAPADHLILQRHAFLHVCNHALEVAGTIGGLITLGVKPTHPNPYYGYIRQKRKARAEGLFPVENFIEKPIPEKAVLFQQDESYLWNTGIYVWQVAHALRALKQHLAPVYKAFHAAAQYIGTAHEDAAIAKAYAQCEAVSIDTGIIEKAANVFVIPASFGWSDISTWIDSFSHKSKHMLDVSVPETRLG